jgi:hypothetical protein
MRQRALRIIILLWLGWYLAGPLAEVVDRWDGPRAEVHDIQSNAGGRLTLLAAAFCFAIFWVKKLREYCRDLSRTFCRQLPSLRFTHLLALGTALPVDIHSPPFPLRI